MDNTIDDHLKGCLYGFAIGDAMGSSMEYSQRDSVEMVTEMEFNYLYDLPAGCWARKQVKCCVYVNQ